VTLFLRLCYTRIDRQLVLRRWKFWLQCFPGFTSYFGLPLNMSDVVRTLCLPGLVLVAVSLAGCGENSGDKDDQSSKSNKTSEGDKTPTGKTAVNLPRRRRPITGISPIDIGNGNSKTGGPKTPNTPAAIRAKLKPFQVIVGQWNGLARGSAKTEQPKWRWDFSQPKQPALAFEAEGSGYLKSGRLTFLPGDEHFRLIAETKDGTLKTYTGKLTEPVADVSGDGKRLERTFTLTFKQTDPKPQTREPFFQIAFQQLKNDRYLTIIHRKTGSRLRQSTDRHVLRRQPGRLRRKNLRRLPGPGHNDRLPQRQNLLRLLQRLQEGIRRRTGEVDRQFREVEGGEREVKIADWRAGRRQPPDSAIRGLRILHRREDGRWRIEDGRWRIEDGG